MLIDTHQHFWNLASDDRSGLDLARTLCAAQPGMNEDGLSSIFGGNARRFYRLP